MHNLEKIEMLRYQRHLPVIGIKGQQQLKDGRILCIGAGGLGCPALQYLAAAGVGKLGIMDADQVELSNLQRQILFTQDDVGRNKAIVISERLQKLNRHINIKVYPEFLSAENAQNIIKNYDVILDATDNYEARYLINRVSRELNIPVVSASIYQFNAQLSVFNYQDGACYQCLYAEPPPAALVPNCEAGGVLGVLPGVAGTMQATEAIKILLGVGEVLSGTLLSMDLLTMEFKHYKIIKQNCDKHPEITHKTQDNSQPSLSATINTLELSALLNTDKNKIQLIDVREAYEREICNIGGEHIPLSMLESQSARFDRQIQTIVYCKSGKRSATACQILADKGFVDVKSLSGGILEWIDKVDNELSTY